MELELKKVLEAISLKNVLNLDVQNLITLVNSEYINGDCYLNNEEDRKLKDKLSSQKLISFDTEEHPYTGWTKEIYSIDKKDIYKIIASAWEDRVIDIVELYGNIEATKKNFYLTDEQMKAMQPILKNALQVELQDLNNKCREGKISLRQFNKYIERYNNATQELLPNMVKNWEDQKQQREYCQMQVAHIEENKKAKVEAAVKRKERFKSIGTNIRNLFKSLKNLHEQKKEERLKMRELKAAQKRAEREKRVDALVERVK